MTYTPINVGAYTSAFAGAIAGMAVSGWITDPLSADYSDVVAIAGAFAQSFDTVWNNASTLNNLELAAITAVVQEDFNGRGPGPFRSTRFKDPTNWNITSAACAALILECDAFFAGQGISPGTGSFVNLSNVLYVDGSTTVLVGAQTGNIEAPFSTIQAAINACPVGGTVLITTAGNYSATITIPNSLTLKALSNSVPGIAQTNNNSFSAASVVLGTVNITTGNVTFDGMTITEIKCADNTVHV